MELKEDSVSATSLGLLCGCACAFEEGFRSRVSVRDIPNTVVLKIIRFPWLPHGERKICSFRVTPDP